MQKNTPYILSFVAFIFTILISYQNSLAQQVRWCYSSTNIRNVIGAPNSGLKTGPSKYAGEPKIEDPAAEIKSPIEVHLKYKALDSVRQIIIIENYNPGCIAKIEIGNKSLSKRQTVYEGIAEKTDVNFRINNILFDVITYPVTDVWLSCEPDKVPGNNQIDAVGISSLSENYIPQINLPLQPFFEGEATQLKMEYVKQNHRYSASTPVVNTNETQLFFSSNIANMFHNEELFEVNMLNDTNKVYKRSEYNFPLELSTATGIIAAFDNELVLSNMSFPKPTFYIAKRSEKNKIDYFPFTIHNYKNDRGAHQYEIMSNDKKVMIIAQTRDANNEVKNKQDMYVCFREQDGNYSSPVYMGDVLNTNGNEVPSYINKTADTLYFSSDGHLGFGNRDIFYSVRTDSTFLNWTEPKNLGNILNSEDKEIYFTISPTKKVAYFTRNGKIMQLKIADPYKAIAVKKEVVAKDTTPAVIIKPTEIILVKGFVLNKTNDKPVEADISVFNLTTNEKVLFSKSDSISGEYDLILTSGYNYSINAVAEDFIAVSENVDLTDITESTEIEKNLYLVPFLVGQTVRLNNIFFETAKWDLLPESNQELDKLFIFLKNNSTIIIEIAGHTDNQGDDGSNKILSENRAKAVMDYLLQKGVEKNRISSVGFGETKPETTNETDEGRMRNRRVEFKIIAQ